MNEKIYHLGIKALIQDSSGKILLLKVNQKKFTNPTVEDYWDIPGGRVLEGHTLEDTLHREVEEETRITNLDFFSHLDTIISNIEIPLKDGEKAGLILSIYTCIVSGSPYIQLSEENTDYAWFFLKKPLAFYLTSILLILLKKYRN
jgi:8-oxo-dGTP pyrophosphatase MutT (NUDIX family)